MSKYLFKEGAGKHRMAVKNGDKVEYRLLRPNEIVELTDRAVCGLQGQVRRGRFTAGRSVVGGAVRPGRGEEEGRGRGGGGRSR